MERSQYGQVTYKAEADAAFPEGCTEGNNSGGDCPYCQIYYGWDKEEQLRAVRSLCFGTDFECDAYDWREL